jgi:hypothetical protein
LHLHIFFKCCFSLKSKPSLYVSNTRRKVLQIPKSDLNSNQKFLQVSSKVQSKNRKETKRKEKKKIAEKAAGQHSGPGQLPAHGPISSLPELFSPFSPAAADTWAPLVIPSKQTGAGTTRT